MSPLKKSLLWLAVTVTGVVAAIPFMRPATTFVSGSKKPNEQTGLPWVTQSTVVPLQIQSESSDSTAQEGASLAPSDSINEFATTRPVHIVPPSLSGRPELPIPRTQLPPKPTSPHVRYHTVVDGDTLQSLAKKYLGSRDRWEEILGANKKWIADRHALPLGFKLQIPNTTDELDSPPYHIDAPTVSPRTFDYDSDWSTQTDRPVVPSDSE